MNRAMQPPGNDRLRSQLTGLSGKRDEGRLRGFLGQMRIPELSHRRRVDEVNMSRDQCPKRLFGPLPGVGV